MRFSPVGRPQFVDEVLGERALSIEARALPAAVPGLVRVLFAGAAASSGELAALRAIRGSLVEVREDGLLCFTGPAAELDELADRASKPDLACCLRAAVRHARLALARPRLMAVLNVTPDSFSDGGTYLDPERAVRRGLELAAAGADIIDVGGESTRPGAPPVEADVELERVTPVIRELSRTLSREPEHERVSLSVDTSKARVAAAALEAGATIVNDVSAGRNDPRLFPVVAEHGAALVLMHMRGTPRDMQERPLYGDVVREVTVHLRERAAAAWRAGIDPARIALDPGLGFGKRLEDNLELLRGIPELRSLGMPLVVGSSRKSFLGRLSGEERPAARIHETSAAVALAAYLGAEIHRVHEVGPARAALRVAAAVAARAEAPSEALRS